MAIKQERLIALLDIIDSIVNRRLALKAFLARQRPAIAMAKTPEEALELCDQAYNAVIQTMQLTEEEYRTFVHEVEHFKYNAAKNKATAEACRRFRIRQKMRREEIENENLLDQMFGPQSNNGPNPNRFVETPTTPKKPRDPWLNDLTLDTVHTLITKMQADLPEPITSTDIATIWRSRGGTDDEVKAWIDRLLEEGLLVPGKYNGEFEVL